MEIKQAVIFAGGKGTRLMPLTEDRPKPMVNVNGKPFLYYLLKLLKEEGIEKVVILLGYKGEVIRNYCEKEKLFGLDIQFSQGEVKWETGKRLQEAKGLMDENFLLMYCDNYWPLQLKKLVEFHKNHGKRFTMTVYSNRDKITKNNLYLDENGLVTLYDKSRTKPNLNGVDIGFFIMNRSLIDEIPEGNISFEAYIFPRLVELKQLAGYLTHHRYFSCSNLEKLETACAFFTPKKAIFIDRDGVINKKAPKAEYVTTWKQFEFLPGVLDALKILKDHGYTVIIVSNQAGINRHYMTHENLADIHAHMCSEIEKNGGNIHAIYYCPHDWDEGCLCRKPNPGMFFSAVHDHLINLREMCFIGDDPRDRIAGEAAGLMTYLVEMPDADFPHLLQAVEHITQLLP